MTLKNLGSKGVTEATLEDEVLYFIKGLKFYVIFSAENKFIDRFCFLGIFFSESVADVEDSAEVCYESVLPPCLDDLGAMVDPTLCNMDHVPFTCQKEIPCRKYNQHKNGKHSLFITDQNWQMCQTICLSCYPRNSFKLHLLSYSNYI